MRPSTFQTPRQNVPIGTSNPNANLNTSTVNTSNILDSSSYFATRASTPSPSAPIWRPTSEPSGNPICKKTTPLTNLTNTSTRTAMRTSATGAATKPAARQSNVSVMASPAREASAAEREGVLCEARALRRQAEELSHAREGNIEALERQMADLRRRSKEELLKMEKRNRQLAADNEGLARDLGLKSTRAQREGDVARQWEAAWTSESQQRRCLEQNLKESERKLAQEHLDHTLEKEQRETLEQRLETTVLQSLAQRQDLESARDSALADQARVEAHVEKAEAELSQLRPMATRSHADLTTSSLDNEGLRSRNTELQQALAAAQQSVVSLSNQLQDSEKRRELQAADLVRQRDEVMEINAQLCGHRNAKQKIQYLLKVKEEKEELKKDKTRLEAIVKNLAGSPAAAASLLSARTICDANDYSMQYPHDSNHANDSTNLSLAPTEGAPATPGPYILDISEAQTPAKNAAGRSSNGPVTLVAPVPASTTTAATAATRLTQPRSPKLQTALARRAVHEVSPM